MKEKGMFLAIYGLDGVGKTTVVSELNRVLNGSINFDEYKNEIANPYALSKEKVLGLKMDDVEFFHYVGSNIFQGKIISELTESGKTVIKSRWHLDILADFSYRKLDFVDSIEDKIPFLIPDLSVLLVADDDIRRRRITSRAEAPTKNDLNLERSIVLSKYFEASFSRKPYNSKNFIKIETSDKSPEEIVDIIRSLGIR